VRLHNVTRGTLSAPRHEHGEDASYTIAIVEVCPVERALANKHFVCAHLIFEAAAFLRYRAKAADFLRNESPRYLFQSQMIATRRRTHGVHKNPWNTSFASRYCPATCPAGLMEKAHVPSLNIVPAPGASSIVTVPFLARTKP
jgi:hypothetical protein